MLADAHQPEHEGILVSECMKVDIHRGTYALGPLEVRSLCA